MVIDNIEIELADIKLTRPYTIAYKTTSSIKNIFIKIILKNGVFGLGSSNVSKYVVGLDTTESYKNAVDFKNELIGKNITYLIGNIDKIENQFINDPGSKAAYNIALYDTFCKSLNISLGSFLGRVIPELPTSITV
jgi:L-alanine-DL-glutamate epimerase-like enolase superfamily enzyme